MHDGRKYQLPTESEWEWGFRSDKENQLGLDGREWVADWHAIYPPGPVTNQSFMATLRRLTGHTWGIPVPAWLLKIGALMIGTETELVLKSRWVLPTKLEEDGFAFRYRQVEDALRSLITK